MRRPSSIVSRALLAAVLGLPLAIPRPAESAEPSPSELAVIEARLASVEPYARRIRVTPGDTRFFELRWSVPSSRLRTPPSDYEGLITGIVAPAGIVVHARVDQLTFSPAGNRTEIRFVYALHVEADGRRGGRVRLTAHVVERTGLANTVTKKQVRHRLRLGRDRPTARDLAADFRGFRYYSARARGIRHQLKASAAQLPLSEQARLPSLSRASVRVAGAVQHFDRMRRRMWAAHRHLIAASALSDPKIARTARTYLKNLSEPDEALSGMNLVPLVDPSIAADPDVNAAPPAAPASAGESRPLEPVATYDPNAPAEPPPPPPAPAPETSEPRTVPPVALDRGVDPDPGTEVLSSDILAERTLTKQTPIPGFSRGLVLDDPNIAHGAAARFIWAEATVRETAVASALFFHAQGALTPTMGLEVTVPTEFVDIDEPEGQDRIQSVFATGNPLLAFKYRLHLPPVQGRRPALTLRARWSIPMSPLHLIPPTTLGAEDFTREVHFADTYAFLLEKTGLGLGINAAYQWGMVHFGAQVGGDVFLAVGDIDTTNKVTINYGFSVGVLPFGDLVGAFAEARAVSLLPARTEFFTYLGFRGRVLRYLEPGLWLVLPLGSVRNANTFQIGAELRFSYDVYDVVEARSTQRRDDRLLE